MIASQSAAMVRHDAFKSMQALRSMYESAEPYPHVVIDDFLDIEFAHQIHDEARATAANQDASNGITQFLKVACTDWESFDVRTHALISYFNSSDFIDKIQEIVGIENLFGDPQLEGGGIHMTGRGGFLKMHTDFNWHERLQADRRINVLYYLNKDWVDDYQGELMLSDLSQKKTASIKPLFNRLVIFNTNDATLNGHPDPLMFPENYPRASIAMYYYSRGRPSDERLRGRATTTRYLPRNRRDISRGNGSIKAWIGYIVRRFLKEVGTK